jgi:hypothetical protein
VPLRPSGLPHQQAVGPGPRKSPGSPRGSLIATCARPTRETGTRGEPVFDLWVLDTTATYSAELASEVGIGLRRRSVPTARPCVGKAASPTRATSQLGLCTWIATVLPEVFFSSPEGEPGIEIPGWIWSPDDFHRLHPGDNLYLLREGNQLHSRLRSGWGHHPRLEITIETSHSTV